MHRALLFLLFLAACHPLSLYAPPPLPARVEAGVKAKVEVLIDDRGVPHIYAGTLPDAVYALGFMHARDRLWQVVLVRHAAQGRLTELFGERMLLQDRRLRLQAYGLDAHLAALSDDDRRLLDAYAAGLSEGAQRAGQSAEMALLGLAVPHFGARDALSVMRLQAWQLGADHLDELARYRLLELLAADDPRRPLIDAPVPTGGVSITGQGDGASAAGSASGHGAVGSNSWAVDAAHTASARAVLSNDPHLGHQAPGVFYLAHVETPEVSVAGATFAGAPLFAIGFGRHVAWGMTTSYADAQDLLRIKVPDDRPDAYELDGELQPFERRTEKFVIGEKVLEETWLSTRFGPLLPEGYPGFRANDPLALHWGAMVPAHGGEVVTGFFELAAAVDPPSAGRAVEKLRGSGQNVLLAFTDGSIAYRLAAFTPLRPVGETGRLPRDGSKSANAFGGWLSIDERPMVTNPPGGYLVAANQRVVGDGAATVGSVGTTAVPPSRARRIHQRLEALLARPQKPTVDELAAIQQDVVSPEARALAPRLAALCPHLELPALCGAVARFDGTFSANSFGALPYTLLLDEVSREVVRSIGFSDPALLDRVANSLPLRNAVGLALTSTEPQPLIDLALVAKAARSTQAQLEQLAGPRPGQWRYGRAHTLQPRGALAAAPLLGGFFEGPVSEQGGDGTTVRAEDGLPVSHGACLRLVVELSDPPVGRAVIDTGQSGHPRTPHWMDMAEDWANGTLRVLPTLRAEVEAAAQIRFELLP